MKNNVEEKQAYEKVYQYENLYQAHLLARRSKRHKDEVVKFELDLTYQLRRLSMELEYDQYRIKKYRRFKIYDPKERDIYALAYRDRVVQHSICDNIIAPYMEKHLIYDNAASRKNKGTHFAIDRLSSFYREYYNQTSSVEGYILRFDIKKYFDNIDHEILKQILEKAFGYDKRLMGLLYQLIDSYEKTPGKGLPLGNQTSQWFALYYLDGLDRLIKEKLRIKYYSRYMDDGVIIHHDREYLKECLNVMTGYIRDERKLEFNQKTQVIPIAQGTDYLGFRFYLTDTGKVIRRLRNSNKKRMKRKLKRFRHAYREGKMSSEEVKRSLVSYMGHLSHGHTYRLRQTINGHLVLSKRKQDFQPGGEKIEGKEQEM